MVACGFKPDNVTIVSTLSASARSGDLEKGKAIHDYVKGTDFSYIRFCRFFDFYAKCGFIESVIEIFKDINTLIVFGSDRMEAKPK